MKVVDVNYQLMFNNKFFCEKKKFNEVKEIVCDVFEKMIEYVKKNFCFGDIMRVVIYNEKLDLFIYVLCCLMEEMNVEVMMESLVNVFNSNEDILFDFICCIDIGVIKYLCGGKGLKMINIDVDIIKKKFIVVIKNIDNLCLLRVVFVVFCGVCRMSNDEYRRLKNLYFIFILVEIFIQFEKCLQWYYR